MSEIDQAPLLTVSGLHVHFGAVTAVDGVDVQLWRGEVLGIVGESGSGKSTLGRVIANLVAPTRGQVMLEGEHVDARRKAARPLWRSVQMIFQDPYSSLDPRRTIQHCLAEPLRVHRLCRADAVEQRVAAALDEVGLGPQSAHKYPHELSGGQRQRVAIARALIVQPALIVADEAVAALDVSVRAQILNLLRRLKAARHLSMLFISHDLAVVRYLCERTAVMYRGRIVECGDTAQILSRPQHSYTQELRQAVLTPPA
ncbi:MAG: ATP-binding cassette domain-containing protein [Steroidobacteraceae bacterium]